MRLRLRLVIQAPVTLYQQWKRKREEGGVAEGKVEGEHTETSQLETPEKSAALRHDSTRYCDEGALRIY